MKTMSIYAVQTNTHLPLIQVHIAHAHTHTHANTSHTHTHTPTPSHNATHSVPSHNVHYNDMWCDRAQMVPLGLRLRISGSGPPQRRAAFSTTRHDRLHVVKTLEHGREAVTITSCMRITGPRGLDSSGEPLQWSEGNRCLETF